MKLFTLTFCQKTSVIFVLWYRCGYEFRIHRSGTGSIKNTFFANPCESGFLSQANSTQKNPQKTGKSWKEMIHFVTSSSWRNSSSWSHFSPGSTPAGLHNKFRIILYLWNIILRIYTPYPAKDTKVRYFVYKLTE